MRELSYSRSKFFREQRKAIAMLASLLREKLPRQELLQQTPSPIRRDDMLHAEAGRVLARRETVDPTEVVRGVLEVVRNLAEQRGVTLACDLDPGLPSVYGSRTLLHTKEIARRSCKPVPSLATPGASRPCRALPPFSVVSSASLPLPCQSDLDVRRHLLHRISQVLIIGQQRRSVKPCLSSTDTRGRARGGHQDCGGMRGRLPLRRRGRADRSPSPGGDDSVLVPTEVV